MKLTSQEFPASVVGCVPRVDLVYARVLKEYREEYPDVSEDLIKAQFLNEVKCYTDLFYEFDFDSFTKFLMGCKTSTSRFYVEFRNVVQKLYTRFSIMRDCEGWLGVHFVSLGKSSDIAYKETLYSLFNWSVSQKKVVLSSDKMFYIIMNCVYILFKSQDLNKLMVLKKFAMLAVRVSGYAEGFAEGFVPFLIKLGSFMYAFIKRCFFQMCQNIYSFLRAVTVP